MSRPICLLDCDGVLLDFSSRAYEIIKDLTGHDIPEHEREWDICGHPKLKEHREDIERMWSAVGFSSSLKPYDNAVQAVRTIREELADVYVLTAHWFSNPTWVHERDELLHHVFGFDKKHIIHTHSKQLVRGDVFVDDKLSNVNKWAAANPNSVGMLWPQYYNKIDRLHRMNTRYAHYGWSSVMATLVHKSGIE